MRELNTDHHAHVQAVSNHKRDWVEIGLYNQLDLHLSAKIRVQAILRIYLKYLIQSIQHLLHIQLIPIRPPEVDQLTELTGLLKGYIHLRHNEEIMKITTLTQMLDWPRWLV